MQTLLNKMTLFNYIHIYQSPLSWCNSLVLLLTPFIQVPGALLVLPAACGELFWSAAVLSALGSTLAVIIGLPLNATIIVSGKIVSCQSAC